MILMYHLYIIFMKFYESKSLLLLLFVTFAEMIIFIGKRICTMRYYIWSFCIHRNFTFN